MRHGIIDYEVIGTGTPVLIIHGWSLDRTAMIGILEPVFTGVPGYKRYYIDLPGMGRSDRGDVRNSDDILELLHDFAVNVIGERFMIVGHSYGGLLTRGFIKTYGELISKIVLLCPCVIPGVRQGRVEPLRVIEKDDGLLASLSEEDRDSFTLMNVLLTKDVWERYRDHLMPALARADWDFLNNVLEGSFSFDPDDLEKPCELPCLIIAAKQDSEVGYKDQFDLMKIYTNSTYCAIDRAGHNFPIEQPQIFESVFYSWLSSNT